MIRYSSRVARAARARVMGALVAPLALCALSLVATHTVRAQGTPAALASRTDLGDAVAAHLAGDAALRALLDDATARGVPAEPLRTKVREGVVKGSDGVRIREAVRVLAGRLETARAALDPGYSVGELTAGAGALGSGVAPVVLRDLRKAWPDRPLTVPLGVLTELVADGVSTKAAAERLRQLMSRGATGAQLIALGVSIRSDVAAGYAPGTALELRSKGVLSLLANPFKTSITAPGGIQTATPPGAAPIRPRR